MGIYWGVFLYIQILAWRVLSLYTDLEGGGITKQRETSTSVQKYIQRGERRDTDKTKEILNLLVTFTYFSGQI